MAEIKASGQAAIQARRLRDIARKLEDDARSTTDEVTYRERMEQAARLKDQALDLERAGRWFAYFDRKEMEGRNKGTQSKTLEKIAFLQETAAKFESNNREAIAAYCLQYRSSKVRSLWRAEGERARIKLLNFMNNHKIP